MYCTDFIKNRKLFRARSLFKMTRIIVDASDIVLQDFTLENKDQLFELIDRNREHLRDWLFWVDFTKTPEDSLNFIESVMISNEQKKSLVLGMWRGNELLGAVFLVNIQDEFAELGYWICQEEQGKGYITVASQALINFTFENYAIAAIRIKCVAANTHSHAVIRRLDLPCISIPDETQWIHGEQSTEEIAMFCGEITRPEWALRQQDRMKHGFFLPSQAELKQTPILLEPKLSHN